MIDKAGMPECENCEVPHRSLPSRNRLLVDPERARREDEQERRKLRLLQVREESRKLAHKIRQDVAAEKQRQIDKFNATKAAEMECWRQNAMAQEDQRYTWAVVHLGLAHNAAMLENANRKSPPKYCHRECTCMYQKNPCKATSSHSARRSRKGFTKFCRNQSKNLNVKNSQPTTLSTYAEEREAGGKCCVPDCPQNRECICSHETDTGHEQSSLSEDIDEHNNSYDMAQKENEDVPPKVPINSNNNSYCSIGNTSITSETSLSSQNIIEDSTSNKECKEAKMPKRCRTPTVLVDVEVGPDDCIEITSPYYGECFCKNNNKFNRIVIANPRNMETCNRQCEPIETNSLSNVQLSTERSSKITTIESKSSKSPDASLKLLESHKAQKTSKSNKIVKRNTSFASKRSLLPPKRKSIRALSRAVTAPVVKKSTAPKSKLKSNSSGRIAKHSLVDKARKQSTSLRKPSIESRTSTAIQPSSSPRYSSPFVAKQLKVKSKSVSTREANTQTMADKRSEVTLLPSPSINLKPTSSTKNVCCQTPSKSLNNGDKSKSRISQENRKDPSQDSTSTYAKTDTLNTGTVLTFDYNNKLSNKYVPFNKVLNRNVDRSIPTAMEEAKKENILRQKFNEELKEKSLVMENRCQIALEREQIRQDYNDLAEKLEALLQKYPDDLPSTSKTAQMVADKRLRLENKLAAAIEGLLNKPAIITCPEIKEKVVQKDSKVSATNKEQMPNELNVAESPLETDDFSKSSCCSLLLEYVNDQVKEVQKDLNQGVVKDAKDEAKNKRLCNLLGRLDRLRNSLLNYLDKTKAENALIAHKDNINKQETTLKRSDLQNEGTISNVESTNVVKPLISTSSIQEKLTYSEQKLHGTLSSPKRRYSGKIQKPDGNGTIAKEKRLLKGSENSPLEIIITVRGESRSIEVPAKIRKHTISTYSKPVESIEKQGLIQKNSYVANTLEVNDQRMDISKPEGLVEMISTSRTLDPCKSFNSNSTSYCSLPLNVETKLSVITKSFGEFMDNNEERCMNLSQQEKLDTLKNVVNEKNKTHSDDFDGKDRTEMDPMLAQYVRKLLKMPRSAVQALGVSSSEIETPPFSVINTTNNRNILDNTLLQNNEQISRVENFLEDNRNFIKELESTLEAHSQISLDTSRQIFDEIWRCRLAEQRLQKTSKDTKTNLNLKKIKKKGNEILSKSSQKFPEKKNIDSKVLSQSLAIAQHKKIEHVSKDMSAKPNIECKVMLDKNIEKQATMSVEKEDSSKNCVNRIAELTQLIKKVRMEKQRIMEVTLSSVSENGGQRSTNGIEAITSEGTPVTQIQSISDHRENTLTKNKHQTPKDTANICVCRKENIKSSKNGEKFCENICVCQRNNISEKADIGVNIPPSRSLSPCSNSSGLRNDNKIVTTFSSTRNRLCRSPEKFDQSYQNNINNKRQEKVDVGVNVPSSRSLSPCSNSSGLRNDNKIVTTFSSTRNKLCRSPEKLDQSYQNNINNKKQEKIQVGLSTTKSGGLSPPPNRSRLRSDSKTGSSSNAEDNRFHESLSPSPNRSRLRSDSKNGTSSNAKDNRFRRSPGRTGQRHPITSKDICPVNYLDTANNVIIASRVKSRSLSPDRNRKEISPQKRCPGHAEANATHFKEPPATLCRYSNDVIEGNTAHKLSTIAESDKSSVVDESSTEQNTNCRNVIEPVPFPTFEEYMKWLNLSIMDLDAEQSIKLENEFLMYLDALKKCQMEEVLEYKSFPTISRYILQNAQQGNWSFLNLSQHTGSNVDADGSEHLQTLEPEPFTQPPPPLSSSSNPNINSDNDSTPMNLEDELKRRNIIKQSYDGRPYKQIASTTGNNQVDDEMFAVSKSPSPQIIQKVITEGLSTLEEEYVDCIQLELQRLLLNWSKCLKNSYQKECGDNSNSTSSSTSRETSKTTTEEERSACKLGQPINLRQFLTRELVKHATATSCSSSTSTTDDTLRVKFLQAIINNMSTSTEESASNRNLHKTLKKTSTPLPQINLSETSRARDATSSQLFSGESRISSVPFLEPYQNSTNGKKD